MDKPVVYLVGTERNDHLTLRADDRIIGDILFHPTKESLSRLNKMLSKPDFGSNEERLLIGLLHYKGSWPLLFLREDINKDDFDPEFFNETRRVTFPNAFEIESSLVPKDKEGGDGYAYSLLEIRVAPVSDVLRQKLLGEEGEEPLVEIRSEKISKS